MYLFFNSLPTLGRFIKDILLLPLAPSPHPSCSEEIPRNELHILQLLVYKQLQAPSQPESKAFALIYVPPVHIFLTITSDRNSMNFRILSRNYKSERNTAGQIMVVSEVQTDLVLDCFYIQFSGAPLQYRNEKNGKFGLIRKELGRCFSWLMTHQIIENETEVFFFSSCLEIY